MTNKTGKHAIASICVAFVAMVGVQAQTLEELQQQAIREAVDRVNPAVVQLQIIGGADRVANVNLASGPATGLVLSDDGYVVTSRYRFDPAPATVVVILADGRQFASRIVAHDYSRKLVILKLEGASSLSTAEIAPADSIRVGNWAMAVGRTYRSDRPNVSVGIVSATDRIFGRALQTDAAVSPANYGGPVVDIQGRVMGVLSPMSPGSESTIAGVDWYDSGIGFAIPLAGWQSAFERLKNGEDLERGYLGVGLADGVPRETPPMVKSVLPAGPVAQAGLEPGDLIVAINEDDIATQNDLKFAVTPHYAGDTLRLSYERGDEQNTVDVTLATISELQEAGAADAKPKAEPSNSN